MNDAEFQIQAISDHRLADHATSAQPAWLWSADGARILWANPVGAKIFAAASGSELAKRVFGPADPHRRQVAQLGRSLAATGAVRLERLRGFGAAPGMLATCGCARIDLPDGSHGVLVAAVNAAGRVMPLAERLQRLVQGIADRPAAAFTGDGLLIGANEAARPLLGLHDLSEAGLDAARSDALKQGRAAVSVGIGRVVLQRIGRGADTALVALIKPAPHLAAPPKPAPLVAPEAAVQDTAAAETPTSETAAPPPAAPENSLAMEQPPAPPVNEHVVANDGAPAPADGPAAIFTLFDALEVPQETPAEEPAEPIVDVPPSAFVETTANAAAEAHAEPAAVETNTTHSDAAAGEAPVVEPSLTEALMAVTAEAEAEAPPLEAWPDVANDPSTPVPEASAPPVAPVPSPAMATDTPAPMPSAEPPPAALAPAKTPSWLDEPVPGTRRHPLRFMWQMDHEGRFSLGSDEFTRLIGIHTAAGFGRLWNEIAEAFGIDPEGRIMKAFATHSTWSGITLSWPVDGGGRLPVELSGLPVFDRNRTFAGYRGFGVCRDLDGLARLAALRRYEFFSGPTAPQPLSASAAQARAETPPGPAPENPPPVAEPPTDTNTAPPTEDVTEPTVSETSHQADLEPAVETTQDTRQDMRDETSPNVVPFRLAGDTRPPSLTPVENNAFNELARQLSARLESEAGLTATTERHEDETIAEQPPATELPAASEPPRDDHAESPKAEWLAQAEPPPRAESRRDRALLDLLPVGILIYRLDRLLYANAAFLARMGYDSLHALEAAGGLDALYVEPGVSQASSTSGTGTPVTISANQNAGHDAQSVSADARLHTISWDDDSALALIFSRTHDEDAAIAAALSVQDAAPALVAEPAPPQAGQADAEELGAILDTAAEGIIMFDAEGNIHSCNRSAEALFGYDGEDFIRHNLADLFATESRHEIFQYLASLKSAGVASLLDHGRETLGQVRQGGVIPLSVTMGRTRADGPNFFAVFRDLTQAKKSESELREARRLTERAANGKSDMLARISHELRTPLNAIIGFAEVMIGERFGALGNERYVEYMKDIRASGERVIAIVNDLLDLSRIETGKLDLAFSDQNLNEMVESCVAVMQPQANRERIIIRTSLAHTLPPVVADARALRQITLNLIGSSIHLANAGGQVIVSTALSDFGEVMLRVRDTGQSLNDNEVAAALEPFRAPTPSDHAGSGGVSLSLTKALVEANRAKFQIRTGGHSGTLIEVVFSHATARA
ncbi:MULTISPECIES: PAS domain-containing protein [unclassified Bradyrhizobium]|uniref:PAS domain-containing protein n=1 Tax=unclassified Bradyrhizobium TaxID=2631580 RepID=UPI00247859C3|nr:MULTISPECIES: PAS domain-containing protein [unclassified Bradyrhizobium]WGS20199.1 PAS domain S-box protein [Bradyrhizobium sp. ISRA463]WGS27062.1 PAS domain S-box protein [Bradyrhizobium sp. ISRA464]